MAGVGKLGLLPSQVRAGSRSECHQGEAGVRSRGGGSARRPQGRGPASWEAVRLEGVAGGTVAGRKKVPCFQKLRRRLSMPWCGRQASTVAAPPVSSERAACWRYVCSLGLFYVLYHWFLPRVWGLGFGWAWGLAFLSFFFFLVPLPFDSQFPIHKALYTIHGNLRDHRLRKRLWRVSNSGRERQRAVSKYVAQMCCLKKKVRSPKWHFFAKSWTGKSVSWEISTASMMGEDLKLPLSGSIWEPL